jgi:glycosyltransferase involved in cell wall biosynthesis
MRILIVGPHHSGGSLPPYLDVLATGLRHQGATVDRAGSQGTPYDQDRNVFWSLDQVIGEAESLLAGMDLEAYDLLSVHFGNLEIEQLLPALWSDRPRPPVVHHVHTLEPTLFRHHLPDPHWHAAVQRGVHSAAGYVHFGRYSRDQLAELSPDLPATVAYLPTTIPTGTAAVARPRLAAALDAPLGWPLISLYGYAAPWKDAALLHAAVGRMRRPARIVLAGDFWDDPAQAGIDLRHALTPLSVGVGKLVVVPGYLGSADRAALIRASTAAVFPYRAHPSFQGSGAIADYLAHAIPVVATNVANMAELIGDAGCIVPANSPSTLAAALDNITETRFMARGMADRAGQRSHQFSAVVHASKCLEIYRQAIERHQPVGR